MSDLSFLIRAPLRMEVGEGACVTIERWSLDGIEPPQGLGGSEGEARLTLPFQGFEIAFDVTLRRDSETNLMRFVDLDDRKERILRHFYREIVTGRAEPVDGMIAAMDIPVEPVPMSQTRAEAKAQPARMPRPMRAAAVIGLYGMLGALLYSPIISPVVERLNAGLEPVAQAAVPPAITQMELTGAPEAPAPVAAAPLGAGLGALSASLGGNFEAALTTGAGRPAAGGQ
ncbi:hypothetical protein ACRDNQ_15580 [Palleronia sp. KMU-117]|uniref:hypothetical protein n=1 Tax=Palleronia sp. KMU-117 TaxID=3434108 RepID=UPI003D730F90